MNYHMYCGVDKLKLFGIRSPSGIEGDIQESYFESLNSIIKIDNNNTYRSFQNENKSDNYKALTKSKPLHFKKYMTREASISSSTVISQENIVVGRSVGLLNFKYCPESQQHQTIKLPNQESNKITKQSVDLVMTARVQGRHLADVLTDSIRESAKTRTKEETRDILVSAGILDEQGYYSEKYFSAETVAKDKASSKPRMP